MLVNDADAAGMAEVHYGAAKDHPGLVLLTTLGTGIGTAIDLPRRAHPQLRARATSRSTATTPRPGPPSSVKDSEGLSYKRVGAPRLQRYYERLEALLWPDLIVVGGGVSRKSEKFLPQAQAQDRDRRRPSC